MPSTPTHTLTTIIKRSYHYNSLKKEEEEEIPTLGGKHTSGQNNRVIFLYVSGLRV